MFNFFLGNTGHVVVQNSGIIRNYRTKTAGKLPKSYTYFYHEFLYKSYFNQAMNKLTEPPVPGPFLTPG
jgi:hypothetical protein